MLLILTELYKRELFVLRTALGVALLPLAVCIMNFPTKMFGNLGHTCTNPYNLEEVVEISPKGVDTASALPVRPNPGAFNVPNKNVNTPINKRRLY